MTTTKAIMNTFLENRLRHFTWAWFTVPMSTGGISLVLGQLPFRFKGLDSIGFFCYMADVFFFFLIVAAMLIRYNFTKANVTDTLRHPIECLFIPTAQLTFATLIMGMGIYSEPLDNVWSANVMFICFWIYTAVATIQAPLHYFSLFAIKEQRINHTTRNLTPGILLPIFPSMLVGAVASSVCRHQSQERGFPVAIAGLAFQGLGIMTTCFFYALLLRKMMQYGLPDHSHRTGLYICAGPPGFCGLALLGMGKNASKFLPPNLINSAEASDILFLLGLTIAIFLWQLAAFWWLLAAISIIDAIRSRQFHFTMSWWATIFPICGFCVCTILIGQALDSKPILWFATGMAIYLVTAYVVVFAFMIEAVVTRKILWKGKDEDREVVAEPEYHDMESEHFNARSDHRRREEDAATNNQTTMEHIDSITRVNSFELEEKE